MDIEIILLNSLFCYGIYAATFEGMILAPFSNLYEKMLKVYKNGEINNKFFYHLSKPLYGCVVCMSSIWSIIFALVFDLDYNIISINFIAHIVTVAGLNYVLSEMFSKEKY